MSNELKDRADFSVKAVTRPKGRELLGIKRKEQHTKTDWAGMGHLSLVFLKGTAGLPSLSRSFQEGRREGRYSFCCTLPIYSNIFSAHFQATQKSYRNSGSILEIEFLGLVPFLYQFVRLFYIFKSAGVVEKRNHNKNRPLKKFHQ